MWRRFTKMTLGGLFLGIIWGVIYWLILLLTGITVPIIHAILYGIILGTLFGFLNSLLLILITGGKDYSQATILISTTVITLISAPLFVLFSPSLIYLLMNIVLIAIGINQLTTYVLGNSLKMADP